MNVTISLQQSRPSRCTMFPTWHDVTTFTDLRLSVVRMMNRMWIEALKLFRRKQNNSLVAGDLCIEVLLLVVVARSHIACTPVSMHHCTAHNWQASPSVNDTATRFQPLRIWLTDVQNESFLSKITPRNFTSSTTGKGQPLRERWGSEWSLRRWQKWRHTVFVEENLKPLVSAHFCNLFRQRCRCLSITWICFER